MTSNPTPDPESAVPPTTSADDMERRVDEAPQPEAEPETPLEKRLRFSERRNDELRTECLRRGKTVAERGEKIRELEKQLDEVRSQLGAEILRAGQAEAELRRMADEAQQPEAEAAVLPAKHREVYDETRPLCACGRFWPCALAEAVPAVGARQPDTQTPAEPEAHPPTHTWKVESPRRDTWDSWGATHDERVWAAASYEDVIAVAPQRPFRLVRATTTYVVEAEHQPASSAVPGRSAATDTHEETRHG
ncbi:hypothetical protein [Streptomyces sp. NPDC001658]